MARPNIGDRFPIGAVGDAGVINVLTGKTFSSEVAGIDVEGTMPNRGAVNITPGTSAQAILEGYHNGSGEVAGSANLLAENIKNGINIFGVTGNYQGERRYATGDTVVPNASYTDINLGWNPAFVRVWTFTGTNIIDRTEIYKDGKDNTIERWIYSNRKATFIANGFRISNGHTQPDNNVRWEAWE